MATTQYIGSRYVPIFADPAEWNDTRTYEPLTIVNHQGNSYTSKQYVPTGIDISNEDYWALTGNYNSQVEQYRQETKNAVAQVDSRLSENEKNVATQLSAQNTQVSNQLSAQNTQVSNQLSAQNTQVSNQLSANEAKMDTLQSNVNKQVDALSAETQQVETNKNNIATLTSTITNFKTSLKKVLVLGDSFTAGNHTDWVKYIHNYNITNYAIDGAGLAWYSEDSTFFKQLERAHAAFPDSNDVDKIILYGGVNDFRNRDSITVDIGEKLAEWITKAVSYFPNTKIVVCYGNVGRQYLYTKTYLNNYTNFYSWLTGIYETAFASSVSKLVTFINPSSWLKFDAGKINTNEGNYNTDNLHPNVKGAKIIASYMQAIMDGCYAFRPSTKKVTYEGPINLCVKNTSYTDNKQIVGTASNVTIILTVTEDIYPSINITMLNYNITDSETASKNFVFLDSDQFEDMASLCDQALADDLYVRARYPMYSFGSIKDCCFYRFGTFKDIEYDNLAWFGFRFSTDVYVSSLVGNIASMRM